MLSQKAILVYLSISQWAGRKLDEKATSNVETSFSTHAKVGNYTKKLLPGAKQLDAIHRQSGAIRKFFYSNTLPWMTDGTRILSSKNYLDFTKEFRARKEAFNNAVDDFLVEYPKLRQEAKAKLGDLFNEFEYPTDMRLRESFQCEVKFAPLPDVGDFRTEILESEKETFLKDMREVEKTATRECFERLHGVVSKAVEKLNQKDAIFRDSLIENIAEICTLLPKLNVTENAELEKARIEVEAIVSNLSADVCRVNPSERENAAKALSDITKSMGPFMSFGRVS